MVFDGESMTWQDLLLEPHFEKVNRHKGSYCESGIFGSFSISDSKSHSASDLLREFLMLYLVVYKYLIMYFPSMDT